MIISRTPVRLSFFGGGTDYREYYLRNGGAVLGTTISKYVYVSINRLSNFFNYKIRVGYSKSELVNSVNEIIHPSVRECLKFKNMDGNLDIHIFSDLPAKTGLGSSSSFTVGFLNGLYALEGCLVPREQLAKDALFVEQEMIKEQVGSQDQVHAAYGGLNIIRFGEDGFRVHPLIINSEKRKSLEDSLMVFYTGQTRYASEVVQEQIKRTSSRVNDTYLRRMNETIDEAMAIVSNEQNKTMIESFGKLLHESWMLKKSLSSQVSNTLIDEAYDAALAAGAWGGKITGAGGGGFLAFIVAPERQPAIRNALKDFLEVDFKFENEGSTIIYLRE
jgi:D-glycero-alpha-D-manno-heptose-7-phosphate kinase